MIPPDVAVARSTARPTYPPTEREAREAREPAPATSTAPAAGPERAGLCITCAARRTCTFPPVAGGVWHCEEFA